MNVITQAQFWTHVPTKAGHVQTVRAADGYTLLLDRTSGILSIHKYGEPQVVEVSSSAWISITSEPPPRTQSLPEPVPVPEETTKVWTKPKPKKK